MNGSQKSDASIIEALRRKGYKATPQRITICRFALNSRDHPAVQRIYSEVKKVHPTVSLATVYKTIQILKELGLVQELAFAQAQARFDSYLKPHINLVCLQCGNIRDLDNLTAEKIVGKVAASAKFTVTGHRLDLYGLCEKCRRKGPPSNPSVHEMEHSEALLSSQLFDGGQERFELSPSIKKRIFTSKLVLKSLPLALIL